MQFHDEKLKVLTHLETKAKVQFPIYSNSFENSANEYILEFHNDISRSSIWKEESETEK